MKGGDRGQFMRSSRFPGKPSTPAVITSRLHTLVRHWLMRDPQRETLRNAWVFVMTISFSRHCYVESVFGQEVNTWLRCDRHACEWFDVRCVSSSERTGRVAAQDVLPRGSTATCPQTRKRAPSST